MDTLSADRQGISQIDLSDYVVRAGTKREKQIDYSREGAKCAKEKDERRVSHKVTKGTKEREKRYLTTERHGVSQRNDKVKSKGKKARELVV